MSFEGKKALITGGTRGIGKATALLLARKKCDVALGFMRNREAAEKTRQEIESLGVQCLLIQKNIYKVKNIQEIFQRVKEAWGTLDFFVSNAALGVLKPTSELTETGWNLTLDVNAKAFLFGAQEAAKLMQERGGKIVAVSSIGSHFCLPGYAAMGASKAAIETLTRYLAQELAPKGILVNAVSGGPVDTEALRFFPNYQTLMKITVERTPLHRMGCPEDLAKVIVWLLSEDANWVVGQTIVADGGLTLG